MDPVILYTDAEGNGGLGAVLADSAGSAWMSCSAPFSTTFGMVPLKTQIYLLEVLAVGVALRVWRRRLRERSVVVFVDNTAALASLQKGRSRQPEVHGLGIRIWDDLCDTISVSNIKFLWVPSKLNLADLPSLSSAAYSRISCSSSSTMGGIWLQLSLFGTSKKCSQLLFRILCLSSCNPSLLSQCLQCFLY